MRHVGLTLASLLLLAPCSSRTGRRTVLSYPSLCLPAVNLHFSLRVTSQLLSTQNLPVSRDSNDFSSERYVSR